MSAEVININPPNGSRLEPLDIEINFEISNLSYEGISQLSISNENGIIFKDNRFQPPFLESSVVENNGSLFFSIIKSGLYDSDGSIYFKIFSPEEILFNYQIGTVPSKPYLYYSNLKNNEIVKSAKVFRFEFGDFTSAIDESKTNIFMNNRPVITSGSVSDFFANSVSVDNSDFYCVTIDHPDYFKNGEYNISYDIFNSAGKRLSDDINFLIKLNSPILPSIFPQVSFSGSNLGLKQARNIGDGNIIDVSWNKFIPRSSKSEMMSLVYINTDRLSLFETNPKYISFGEEYNILVSGLEIGKATAFAVRGLESFSGTFTSSGLEPYDGGGYVFPKDTEVLETLFDYGTEIHADSTFGYPDKGLLILSNSEVIKYYSKDENTFFISNNGRGLNNTSVSIHPPGSTISLFISCQDKNTNIATATPAFNWGNDSGREIDRVGEIVTDLTEDDKRFFQGYDYCGYHQSLPENILNGKDECGSYLGGEFNGHRGFNVFDRVNSRNEILLEQVGEKIVLLKRKWSGPQCDCVNLRAEHPRNRTCFRCFGTGFVGGYDQFINKRRNDGRVLVRFKETKDDLDLSTNKHLNNVFQPSCWTLTMPSIRDRDIIVRFDFVNNLEYMYEVLDVSRERIIYNHYGRQNLTLQKLEKTDIIYKYKFLE